MTINIRGIAFTGLSALLVGCATAPEEVQPAYVDPMQYRSYNCDQVAMSMTHRSRRIADLNATMADQASDDSAAVGVSLILFWPAAFLASGGNEQQVAEYSRLLGEYDALQEQAVLQECGELDVKPPSTLIAEAREKESNSGSEPQQESNDENDDGPLLNCVETPQFCRQ